MLFRSARRNENLLRKLEIAGAAVFLALAVSHWQSPHSQVWIFSYVVAAVLSLVPSRNLLMLCLTGLAATAYGFGGLVVAGLMDSEPSFHLLTKDALGLISVSLWFAMIFIRDLREPKGGDRLNIARSEFVSLRNLGR